MAREMDPILRLAMEARILCLDQLQSVVLAIPTASRRLMVGWLASDLDVLDRADANVLNSPETWRQLMDEDPRSMKQERI